MSELPALSESLALPSLFTQLQVRYPTSGLLTELVQMDADRYVVRALVQLGSMTLATSMATATTVEQAEDQARLRVLALLGIHTPLSNVPAGSFGYSTPTHPLTSASQETTPLVDRFDSTTLNHSSTAAPLATVEPIAPPMSFSTLAFEPTAISATTPLPAFEPYVADLTMAEREPELFDAPPDLDDASYNDATYEEEPYDKAPYDEEPFEEDEPIVEEAASDDRASADSSPVAEELAAKSKPRKSSAEKAPMAESDTSSSASRDLSSLISQIGVEIDRIGWSKRQGSTYLQKTYGKKTRSELTDDELEDFLTYLNTQPSATVSS
ncbi:hypothetical protein H6F86_14530 [Phormidium sp. FACHB-592]|uniref:DRBM domain-containing protein n=1 Tax=Stenomitos frigidus AS-A4 TaxID=2933935 RepID=A0ABV0KLM0_9CYAN|nr:hypothetical protein [Phormidium sp. FACHB-592]MBD2075091.1 hypothetical protein [Phormidium sp. FACHB-592]